MKPPLIGASRVARCLREWNCSGRVQSQVEESRAEFEERRVLSLQTLA